MLQISNNGPAILFSNYWDSEYARKGMVYLSWNAGTGRLMLPDSYCHILAELKSADFVIVSRGPWPEARKPEAYELLFEDHSNSPFTLHIGSEQTDRLLPKSESGREFNFAVWTRDGLQLELKGRYRVVKQIPDLSAWASATVTTYDKDGEIVENGPVPFSGAMAELLDSDFNPNPYGVKMPPIYKHPTKRNKGH